MTSLVAGGAGFIGSHLCESLLAEGEAVVCVDNLVTGRRANVAPLLAHPAFTFVEHDIVDPLPPLPRVDRVYHLASPASPPDYQRHPLATLRTNSEGTRRLLELAARDGARFLYASTSEIYGDPLENPQREAYRGNVNPVGPRAMYNEGKRFGEAMAATYRRVLGVDIRIARFFNTYGPRMRLDDGRVVTNFVVQALRGEQLTVYGDGSQTRSFQYVDDLIAGIGRLVAVDYQGPVNLGNPEEYTVLELAHVVREITGSTSEIVLSPLAEDDPKQRCPDVSLARSLLGWAPRVPLRVGLARMVAHVRDVEGLR